MEENFVENNYENAVLTIFENNLGYLRLYGPDVERDFHSPFLDSSLQNALRRINHDLPDAAIQDGLSRLRNLESGSLVQKNMLFMDWLQNGLPVKYYSNGQERSALMRLMDYSNIENNEFIAANQWESAAIFTEQNRADLAENELAEAGFIEAYLPKQLSPEEIEAEVRKIMEQTGASSMKDMGKVMGAASKALAGKADGKVISDIVKKLLA